jgi:hypothetical protein
MLKIAEQVSLVIFAYHGRYGLIVASDWQYHHASEVAPQDKDFVKLNKSAIPAHATTAHVSKRKL